MDRAVVDDEKNVDPSILQLIGYVAFVRQSRKVGAKPWDMEILTYVRAKGGTETRLHDLLSIGFGGHNDTLPGDNETLFEMIVREVRRELKEELGYDIPFKLLSTVVQMALLVQRSFLYLEDTPVDTVHLCIPMVINLDMDKNAPEMFVGAKAEVKDLKWEDLGSMDDARISLMEAWSKYMVNSIREHVRTVTEQNAMQELGDEAAAMSALQDPAVVSEASIVDKTSEAPDAVADQAEVSTSEQPANGV
jgi:predicted NUDIX family phosphoesterase